MDIDKFLNEVKGKSIFLSKEGYGFSILDNRIIQFTKINSQSGYMLDFQIFDKWSYISVNGVCAFKRFNIVEQELYAVLGGSIENYYTIYKSPNIGDIPEGLKYEAMENNIHFKIFTQEELLLFMDFLKVFYFNTVIPFFEEYEKLEKVIEAYLLLEREKISKFINGSNDIFYRELALKYIGQPNSFDEFYSYLLKEFEPYKGNSTFDNILLNMAKIKENLILSIKL